MKMKRTIPIRNMANADCASAGCCAALAARLRSPVAAARRTGEQDDLVFRSGKRAEQGRVFLAARRPDVAHPGLHGGAGAAGTHAAADRRGGIQQLQDHAGDHAGGRAGQPHRGHAGRARERRPTHALRYQPRLFAVRSAYIKARDALQLADKYYMRAQDLYAHKAIAQADLEQAESDRTQAQADLQSSAHAIRVLGISDPECIW